MEFDEILEFLLEGMSEKGYDTTSGEACYDICYALAELANAVFERLGKIQKNAYAKTAVGQWLDLKVAEQGIERKDATKSSGILEISGERGAIAPAQTKVAADDILFQTDTEVTIPEEGVITVGATCMTAGAYGNVAAGSITRFPVTVPGLTAVNNPEAFVGGTDGEEDGELRERWEEKTHNPNNGGNINQLIQWAKEVPGVGDADAVECWDGPGTVKVIIIGTDGELPTESVITDVSAVMENHRYAGGSEITVVSAKKMEINVSVQLISDESVSAEAVKSTLSEFFSGSDLKSTYVSYAHVGKEILKIEGVNDYSELTLNGEKQNVILPDGTVPVLGEVVLL